MDEFDAAEIVKKHWLESSDEILSQQITMMTCPYCGKSDRIRILPHDIAEDGNEDERIAWNVLTGSGRKPGLCGFCLNVIFVGQGKAEMIG